MESVFLEIMPPQLPKDKLSQAYGWAFARLESQGYRIKKTEDGRLEVSREAAIGMKDRQDIAYAFRRQGFEATINPVDVQDILAYTLSSGRRERILPD